MAANIYGLMTLDLYNEELDKGVNRYERLERELRRSGYSPFGVDGYRSRHYSSKLTKLVEDCLRLDPKLRPGAKDLVRRTAEGLKPYTERYLRTGKVEGLRLGLH